MENFIIVCLSCAVATLLIIYIALKKQFKKLQFNYEKQRIQIIKIKDLTEYENQQRIKIDQLENQTQQLENEINEKIKEYSF